MVVMCDTGVFFFQAKDGIRVHCVTGVQTCALPIFFLLQGNGFAFGPRANPLPCNRNSQPVETCRVIKSGQPSPLKSPCDVAGSGAGSPRSRTNKIGRASCREGVERS